MIGVVGAETWGRGFTMVEVSKNLLRNTGAQEIPLIKNDVIGPAESLDTMLLIERRSLVNSPEAEFQARQWLANRLALEDCGGIRDLKKPANAPKDWKTKFNWELYHRVNARGRFGSGIKNRALEGEVTAQRAQDATFENLRARLEGLNAQLDPVNNF
jgi:hypothetical protein